MYLVLYWPLLTMLFLVCRPAETVMSDSNLAWAVTQALLFSREQNQQSHDLKEWFTLRSVNKAFKDAAGERPLTLHIPQQLSQEGRWCMERTKLSIAELHSRPGDALVTRALLSKQFRSVSGIL